MRADHRRTIIITTRWSRHEKELLEKLALRAGANSLSVFVRARALTTESSFRLPAYETLRNMRNELIKLRLEIGKVGGVTRKLEDRIVSAMEAISRF